MEGYTKQIPKERWGTYLENLTKQLEGRWITMEVLDKEFGDQYEVEKLPLAFFFYDHKDDVVEIAVGGWTTSFPVELRHFVHHPTEIWEKDLIGTEPTGFLIVDTDGRKTVITVHEPPALPE